MGSLLFLGTGASSGVPVIGCSCPVCTSSDPKNRRLRASILIQMQQKTLLIDAGPDFREQALSHQITHLDGLILTHTHYDHVGGLEELRIYNFMQKMALPCLLSRESFQSVQKLFYYLFEPKQDRVNFTSSFDFHPLDDLRGVVQFLDLPIRYFSYEQSSMQVLGCRFGDLAYVTDIKHYPDTIFHDLEGVSTLILSGLRFGSSAMQFSIDEALDFAAKVGAKMTYLMHMSHDIEFTHIASLLPQNIRPAYDGLSISFKDK
jgi:phosphoribosyl 1,2-cyclic phosphate phosphodiesterase